MQVSDENQRPLLSILSYLRPLALPGVYCSRSVINLLRDSLMLLKNRLPHGLVSVHDFSRGEESIFVTPSGL